MNNFMCDFCKDENFQTVQLKSLSNKNTCVRCLSTLFVDVEAEAIRLKGRVLELEKQLADTIKKEEVMIQRGKELLAVTRGIGDKNYELTVENAELKVLKENQEGREKANEKPIN